MNIDKHRAPLFERLMEHVEQSNVSLHVPGHKSGQGLDLTARPYYESIMRLDLTEISGLDDLHHPEEAILEAQRLAADCFGAEESFFLVNGSTVGNLAMILSVCRRGDLLLVQRDAHKSVIHGLMLAGARAVFVNPELDAATGMTRGLRLEAVHEALEEYPEAKGLLVTRPSYYGMALPLQSIAQLLHEQGKLLLVDEAHGAHLGFHPALPSSALFCGADAVVQSTHKLLTAMTMGAMLHVQGELIDRKGLKQCLTMLQSSSPSYPLMASLDLSRRQMHTQGSQLLGKGIAVVEKFTKGIELLSDFTLLTPAADGEMNGKDPFKVTIKDAHHRLSGFELRDALEQQGCFVELADPQAILLVFSLASTEQDVYKVLKALKAISAANRLRAARNNNAETIRGFWSTVMVGLSKPVSFEALNIQQKSAIQVALEDAEGMLSAEMIVPYPPGIPVLYPGERISAEVAAYLMQLVAMGARVHGLFEGEQPTLSVFSGTES